MQAEVPQRTGGALWIGILVGLAAILLVWVVRYSERQLDDERLLDESIYLAAFEALAAGTSPYAVDGYLYPPAFAHAGVALASLISLDGVWLFLRIFNQLGLLVILWATVRWAEDAGARIRYRHWALLGVVLALSNGVFVAVICGNVSFLAGGLLMLGLAASGKRPFVAGLLLALSVSIKPYAAPAVLVLAVAGWRNRGKAWLGSSLTALALGFSFSLPSPWLGDMLRAAPSHLVEIRSASLYRIGLLAGVDLSRFIWLGLALAVLAAFAWRWAERPLIVRALCLFGVLAMPVVWNHTLVLLFPVVAAAWVMAARRRETAPRERWIPWIAGLCVWGFESGSVDLLPRLPQAVLLSVPWIVGFGLLAYLLHAEGGTKQTA